MVFAALQAGLLAQRLLVASFCGDILAFARGGNSAGTTHSGLGFSAVRSQYRDGCLGTIDRGPFRLLEALLRLRQAACHPGLIDKTRIAEPSAKLDMLFTQLDEILEEGHKALVFSQFTSLLSIVRKRLDVRKASFAAMDDAVQRTGMAYGGITPFGLPADWPLLIDSAVAAADAVVVGSGVRHSKLFVPGEVLTKLPSAEVIDGLGRPVA